MGLTRLSVVLAAVLLLSACASEPATPLPPAEASIAPGPTGPRYELPLSDLCRRNLSRHSGLTIRFERSEDIAGKGLTCRYKVRTPQGKKGALLITAQIQLTSADALDLYNLPEKSLEFDTTIAGFGSRAAGYQRARAKSAEYKIYVLSGDLNLAVHLSISDKTSMDAMAEKTLLILEAAFPYFRPL